MSAPTLKHCALLHLIGKASVKCLYGQGVLGYVQTFRRRTGWRDSACHAYAYYKLELVASAKDMMKHMSAGIFAWNSLS